MIALYIGSMLLATTRSSAAPLFGHHPKASPTPSATATAQSTAPDSTGPPSGIVFTPPPAPPGALTLQQAVQFALHHSPTVLQARAQAFAAGSTLAHGRSLELPNVNANAQSLMQRQSNNSGSFAQFGLSPSPNF